MVESEEVMVKSIMKMGRKEIEGKDKEDYISGMALYKIENLLNFRVQA
jgi:hypothetical protein